MGRLRLRPGDRAALANGPAYYDVLFGAWHGGLAAVSINAKLHPREIEEVVLRHAGVLACSVVGQPHPDWGEVVVAYIVPCRGSDVGKSDLDDLPSDNYGRVTTTAR